MWTTEEYAVANFIVDIQKLIIAKPEAPAIDNTVIIHWQPTCTKYLLTKFDKTTGRIIEP